MRKGLGIYTTNRQIYWAVVSKGRNGLEIDANGVQPMDDDQVLSIPEMPDDIVVCTTPWKSFFHHLSFPFSKPHKIRAVLKNDIEEKSFDPIDSLVVDFYTVKKVPEGVQGFGVTMPRQEVENVLGIIPEPYEPEVVTLDIFVLLSFIEEVGQPAEEYLLAELADTNSVMINVKNGKITRFRSIPVEISSSDHVIPAIDELKKRFEIDEELEVFSAPVSENVNKLSQDSDNPLFNIPPVSFDRAEGLSWPEIVSVAAGYNAISGSKGLPNFRREEFAYPGIFHALAEHSIILGIIFLIMFGAVSGMLLNVKSDYKQRLESIKARQQEELELVLGRETLRKAHKSAREKRVELIDVIEEMEQQYRERAGEGDKKGERQSAFIILREILSYIDPKLDISWDVITINTRRISLRGDFSGSTSDLKLFESFVSKVRKKGDFTVTHKSVRNGTFRLMFDYKQD